jgi:hypothetical protein
MATGAIAVTNDLQYDTNTGLINRRLSNASAGDNVLPLPLGDDALVGDVTPLLSFFSLSR